MPFGTRSRKELDKMIRLCREDKPLSLSIGVYVKGNAPRSPYLYNSRQVYDVYEVENDNDCGGKCNLEASNKSCCDGKCPLTVPHVEPPCKSCNSCSDGKCHLATRPLTPLIVDSNLPIPPPSPASLYYIEPYPVTGYTKWILPPLLERVTLYDTSYLVDPYITIPAPMVYTLPITNIQRLGVDYDYWLNMAFEVSKKCINRETLQLGSVLVRIDKQTDRILEYWSVENQIIYHSDPTAYPEIINIRNACLYFSKKYGKPVYDLGNILDPYTNESSYCVIYIYGKPSLMCYSLINQVNIPIIIYLDH